MLADTDNARNALPEPSLLDPAHSLSTVGFPSALPSSRSCALRRDGDVDEQDQDHDADPLKGERGATWWLGRGSMPRVSMLGAVR
jgi:hypothetical protein